MNDLQGCDIEAYKVTMTRLSELDVDIVHGGHGVMFGESRLHEIAARYVASKEA